MKRLHLILILMLSVTLLGAGTPENKTEFNMGSEPLEKTKETILTIPNAKGLEIKIDGDIHANETLTIYEYSQKKGDKIVQEKGAFKTKQPLIALENKILVTLMSESKTTRKNLKITITALTPEKFLEYTRKDVRGLFEQLEKDSSIETIDKSLKESFEILEHLSKKQEPEELSRHLRSLVEKYQQITNQEKTLTSSHKALQDSFKKLAKDSIKWSKRLKINLKKKSSIEEDFIKKQSKQWLEGEKYFRELISYIENYNKNLKQLFKIMSKNTRVLYEAANTMDLNISATFDIFGNVDYADALLCLDEDWQRINELKENLKNNGFL